MVIFGLLLNNVIMVISIHQPNFFPWYPFFQKMEMSDKFIILSNCQFEKNGFQNRFNLDSNWHTMSTFKGLVNINEKKYVKPFNDWSKLKSNLSEYKDILSYFDDCISEDLTDTNFKIIKKSAELLKINCEIIMDTPTNYTSTERLVELCKINGGTKYVSGISGKNYLDLDLFKKHNIEIVFQDENKMERIPLLKKLRSIL